MTVMKPNLPGRRLRRQPTCLLRRGTAVLLDFLLQLFATFTLLKQFRLHLFKRRGSRRRLPLLVSQLGFGARKRRLSNLQVLLRATQPPHLFFQEQFVPGQLTALVAQTEQLSLHFALGLLQSRLQSIRPRSCGFNFFFSFHELPFSTSLPAGQTTQRENKPETRHERHERHERPRQSQRECKLRHHPHPLVLELLRVNAKKRLFTVFPRLVPILLLRSHLVHLAAQPKHLLPGTRVGLARLRLHAGTPRATVPPHARCAVPCQSSPLASSGGLVYLFLGSFSTFIFRTFHFQ